MATLVARRFLVQMVIATLAQAFLASLLLHQFTLLPVNLILLQLNLAGAALRQLTNFLTRQSLSGHLMERLES